MVQETQEKGQRRFTELKKLLASRVLRAMNTIRVFWGVLGYRGWRRASSLLLEVAPREGAVGYTREYTTKQWILAANICIHLSLLSDCGRHVTSHLTPLSPCLPTIVDSTASQSVSQNKPLGNFITGKRIVNDADTRIMYASMDILLALWIIFILIGYPHLPHFPVTMPFCLPSP